MKTPYWLVAACLAASLPAHASQIFKPIELKDQELAALRGRYVLPGGIISFGLVMTSTWQNASGDVIGANTTLQIQQSTIKPQFYVTLIKQSGNGSTPSQGTGIVTGGAGLNSAQGVIQVVRAAGDNNTAYNNVAINVTNQTSSSITPSGQVLTDGGTITGSDGAGTLNVTNSNGGIQLSIQASNNQGSSLQQLAQGNLMQTTTLLGGSNQVNNIAQLNVVMRNNFPSPYAQNFNLNQLRGLQTTGY